MGFTDLIYTHLGKAVEDYSRLDPNPKTRMLRGLVERTAYLIAEKDGNQKSPDDYWDIALRTLAIPIKNAILRCEFSGEFNVLFNQLEIPRIPEYDYSKQQKDLFLILRKYGDGIFEIARKWGFLGISEGWLMDYIPKALKHRARSLLANTLYGAIEESLK